MQGCAKSVEQNGPHHRDGPESRCDAGEDGDHALGPGTQSVCAESRPVEEKSPRLANQYGGLGGRSDPLAESLAFGQAKHAGLVHVLNCIDC